MQMMQMTMASFEVLYFYALVALPNICICLQVLDFVRTWRLGTFGGMENVPRGFGCGLPAILLFF